MSLVLQDQLVLSPATADHLQGEIDTIKAGSDVTDVVGTYENLENYDTSKLTDNDIIKVLQDETQDNAQTYYRWSTSSREFTYVGKVESKTYTAGNGIDITNDTISVTAPTLVNKITNNRGLSIGGEINGTNISIGTTTVATTPNFYENRIAISPTAGLGDGSNSIRIGASTSCSDDTVAIGYGAKAISVSKGVAVGANSESAGGVSIGYNAYSGWPSTGSIAIGNRASCKAANAIQLAVGSRKSNVVNSDSNTFKVANTNGNFEIMSADGTIPEARLADTTNATQGQVLQLDSNNNAIWADVDGLPDQAGQTGKVLTTNGTDASWETKTTVSFRTWDVNE